MPGFHDRFDPMGLVIDWLDACKERRLSSLIDLYDESATLDCCCEGKTLRGRLDLEAYWGPKLAHSVIGAFEVPEAVRLPAVRKVMHAWLAVCRGVWDENRRHTR